MSLITFDGGLQMNNNCLCNLFDNNNCIWIIIIALLILFCGCGC